MKRWLVPVAVVLLLLPAALALAQSSGGYDLSWWTVDGGGVTWGEGSGYRLGAAIGQPDAGLMTGNGYGLTGGFWTGGAAGYQIYLPLLLRNYP